MTFTLFVVDETHLLLTTDQQIPASAVQHIRDAFDRWKAEGGVVIIEDAVVRDRPAITVDLDIPT